MSVVKNVNFIPIAHFPSNSVSLRTLIDLKSTTMDLPTTWLLTLPFLLTTYRSKPVRIRAWSQCRGSLSPGGFSSLCHVQKLLRNLSMSCGLFKFTGSSCRISSLLRMKFTGLPKEGSWYISCTAFIIARTNLTNSLSVSFGKLIVICLYKSLSTNTAVSTNIAGETALLCLSVSGNRLWTKLPIVLFLWAKFNLKSSSVTFLLTTVASRFLLCLVHVCTDWNALVSTLSLSTQVLLLSPSLVLEFTSSVFLLTMTCGFVSSVWNLSGNGCM